MFHEMPIKLNTDAHTQIIAQPGYPSMKDAFEQKILIHQNLCLAAKLQQYKFKIAALTNQLQAIKTGNQIFNAAPTFPAIDHQPHVSPTSLQQIFKHDWKYIQNAEACKQSAEGLLDQNRLLKQRLTLINRYETEAVERIIQNDSHLCYCGGLKLEYYSSKIQELIKLEKEKSQMLSQQETSRKLQEEPKLQTSREQRLDFGKVGELSIENKVLSQRLEKCEKRLQECKINHKFTIEHVLQSPAYLQLKKSCQSLLLFCSQLLGKQKHLNDHYDALSKEREGKIKDLLKKLEFPESRVRLVDILQKTKLDARLQELKQKYSAVNITLSSAYSKIRQVLKFYKGSRGQQEGEGLRSRKDKRNKNYEREHGFIRNVQGAISEWLNHHCFADYCQQSGTDSQEMKADWVTYTRKIKCLIEDNGQLKYQIYQAQLKLRKEENITEIKEALEELELHLSSLQQRIENTKQEIVSAEFRLSLAHNHQHFRYRKELLKRQQLERHIQLLNSKVPQCKQIVELSSSLTNLLEAQRLQLKLKEGTYLGQLKAIKIELEQKSKLLSMYQDNFKRSLQENSKNKVEIDKLREVAFNTKGLRQSQKEGILKRQIEGILKKITCTCERGHQATVALPCKHILCKPCTEALIKTRKRECPLCRQKFSESTLTYFKYN